MIRQRIETGAYGQDCTVVLHPSAGLEFLGLTCKGANSLSASISVNPSSWPFDIRIPFLCVPPCTLSR